MRSVTTADKVAFLRRPDSYPQPVERVEVKETHMSWVFLTEDRVFKLKKPVRLPYLDFGTLEARRFYCEESLRLNRRLTEGVYLDVLPMTLEPDGGLAIDGRGTAVEWLVYMVRLPARRMLERRIEDGGRIEQEAAAAADLLAAFYRDAPAEPVTAAEHRQRLAADVHENAEALREARYGLDRSAVALLRQTLEGVLERRVALFAGRLEQGRVVEGHGDLRPEHVCLTEPPAVIDCLEFSRELRIVDAVDELAFLALECERLGGEVHDTLFVPYRRETGDDPPAALIAFYKVHRAMLRAKLAVWHLDDDPDRRDKWIGKAEAYLDLADRHASTL
jgi:aminoglycoside phosphotransferase family enzyme